MSYLLQMTKLLRNSLVSSLFRIFKERKLLCLPENLSQKSLEMKIKILFLKLHHFTNKLHVF